VGSFIESFMRNLIGRALSLVLLWSFIGPAALVAASNRDSHECCHRAHHSQPTNAARFEDQAPSHECCRLLFTSQLPRVAATPMAFVVTSASQFTAPATHKAYIVLRAGSHLERAPPSSQFSL
jgi:hypothetical protein